MEALRAIGLTLTHVDTHQNLHLWPSIARATIEVAQTRAASRRSGSRAPTGRSPIALGVRHFAKRLESRARSGGHGFPDAIAGFDEAGRLDLARLRGALEPSRGARRRRAPSWCATRAGSDDAELGALGWGYRGDEELDGVGVAGRARDASTDAGFRLGTFADLVDDDAPRPGVPPKDPQARR